MGSIIRVNQPALTRVLPHPGNRRFAIPDTTMHFLTQLQLGDSLTADPPGGAYFTPTPLMTQTGAFTQIASGGTTLDGVASGIVATLAANSQPSWWMMLGTNDPVLLSATAQEMLADWQLIKNAIVGDGREFFSVGPTPYGSFATITQQQIDTLNEYRPLVAAAAEAQGIPHFDWYVEMSDPANPDDLLPAFTPDGLHFSEAGAAKMAKLLDQSVLTARKRVPVNIGPTGLLDGRFVFEFDGLASQILSGIEPPDGAGAFEVVIRADALPATSYIMSGPNNVNSLTFNSSGNLATQRSATTHSAGAGSIVLGVTTKIRLEWAGAAGSGLNQRLFIDEQLEDTAVIGVDATTAAQTIGSRISNALFFEGVIADLKWWLTTADTSTAPEHFYKINDNSNTLVNSGSAGGSITLTPGAGVWVDNP